MKEYIENICRAAKEASRVLALASTVQKNRALLKAAEYLRSERAAILEANAEDIRFARENGISDAMCDRLMLNSERIDAIAAALEELCSLPDPVGSGERTTRPNGLEITKVRVPLGVIAIIYEARPNVTADAAGLCIKTGNAVVLRGGKEAVNSNRAITKVLRAALRDCDLPEDAVCFVDDTTREGSELLMKARGLVDLLIPRGGRGLIQSVVRNAEVPVIETGAGNCHLYVDAAADLDKALKVALNAKLSRPSVCNAIETLLVHRDAAAKFLPMFASAAAEIHELELRCDGEAMVILPGSIPATEEDYDTEYDNYILAVKVVGSLGEAIDHIRRYTTGHSEAIITEDREAARRFQREIDAAAVYVNASTRFTDGGEFGFGAEMGISTQKLHTRGPMGAAELTTVKFLIDGDGQVR